MFSKFELNLFSHTLVKNSKNCNVRTVIYNNGKLCNGVTANLKKVKER